MIIWVTTITIDINGIWIEWRKKQHGDRLRNNNKKDGRSKSEKPPLNQLILY